MKRVQKKKKKKTSRYLSLKGYLKRFFSRGDLRFQRVAGVPMIFRFGFRMLSFLYSTLCMEWPR